MQFVVYDKYGRQKSHSTTIAAPLEFTGAGGLQLAGGGVFSFPILHVGDGGMELGGEATLAYPIQIVGDGGVELGGEADLQYPFSLVGDGGMEMAGAGEYFQPVYVVTNGGMELGGAAERGEPVHLWSFDENAGTTAADSGVGTPITISSVDGWTTTGLPNPPTGNVSAASLTTNNAAGSFAFSGDILPDPTGDFTIMGRQRITAAADNYDYANPITNTGVGVAVTVDNANGFVLGGGWPGSMAYGTTVVPRNVWYHWVLRRTASTDLVEVLLNGVVDGSTTGTGNPGADTYIGTQSSANNLTVDYDDIRVYNRYVDDAEIATMLPSPPAYTWQDTFTGTDGTNIESRSPDVGPTYTATSAGAVTIQSGKAVANTNSHVVYYATIGNDGEMSVDVTVPTLPGDGTNRRIGPVCRYNGSGCFAVIRNDGFGTYMLALWEFGAFGAGVLDSTVAYELTPGNTYRIKMTVAGDDVSLYQDGVLKRTHTMNASFQTGVTAWGLSFAQMSGSGSLDNMEMP